MTHQETGPKIDANTETRRQGNRFCRNAVQQSFSRYLWIVGNLPGDRKSALYALLNHLVRAIDYLDLESTDGRPLDVWSEFRDEISDALMDEYASPDLIPLVDACRKYKIPHQYLFDILDGVDSWIRDRQLQTFDDVLVFASRFGGSALAAVVPIAGFVKPDYEIPAIRAGQSILLTQILANLVPDMKLNKVFVARQDIDETGLSISRVKVRKPNDGLKHLVRLYGSRIEKLMQEGGGLIKHLDFDARRSFTSLMAVHWEMLLRMRLDPESVLSSDGVLSKRDMFKFKAKHIMGLEGNVPTIPELDEHH